MNAFLKKLVLVAALALPVAVLSVGCDRSASQPENAPAAQANAEPLPADLFLASAPAEPKSLDDVKKAAKDGDQVVVRARVGGRKEPFVDGRAAMTVMDFSLNSCKENPGDNCPTPWDYCCEPANEIAAHSATVQVLGADGRPLRAPLKGAGGLQPLDEVIVKGTVSRSADGQSIVINASNLYVKKS